MPWVRFTADFDFRPRIAVTVAYRAGRVMLVPKACADTAIARGRAERATKEEIANARSRKSAGAAEFPASKLR